MTGLYKSSILGESNLRDVVNSLDRETGEDYKWLIIILLSNEPSIDDTSWIGKLQQLVELHPLINQKCKAMIYALPI